jgi:mono/diheme cytochrome c family protein
MLLNILSMIILIGLTVFFGWLAFRSWRSHRAVAKWLGGIITSLLALIFLAITVIGLVGFYRMNNAPYQYQVAKVKAPMTAENIARGQKMALLCADCHSTTSQPPLDGSPENFLTGGPPMGELWAPNLTPAGPLKDWSDGEIIRAIREGVDKNGRPLIIMPSQGLHDLSDADVQAVVAFIRSQSPVDHPVPPRNLNLLAALFLGAGMFPTSAQQPIQGAVVAPPSGTAEYGHYITRAYGCRDCHGNDLTGSSGGGGPAGPALAGVVSHWSEDGLMKVFRQGVDPNGHQLSDEMPWKKYGIVFSDQDLKDLYSYLQSLPPKPEASK